MPGAAESRSALSDEAMSKRAMVTSLLWIAGANAFLELILYPFWLYPLERHQGSAPISLWLIAYVPLGIACIRAGVRAARPKEAVLIGIAAGVIAQLTKAALAAMAYPGHESSLAATSMREFYTVHFMRMTLGFVALLVLTYGVVGRLSRRTEEGAGGSS